MSRDSSDYELTIVRVNSQKDTPKFSEVPSDTKYTFKFKNTADKAYLLIEYELGQGKKLPHITLIEGKWSIFVLRSSEI